MIHKLLKIYYLMLWIVLFSPLLARAWAPGQPFVPDCARSTDIDGCGFDGFIILINNLLSIFIWLAIPISTLLFAWIGWDFIVSGDKSGARTNAKKRLTALLKGLFFILAPWLIIKLIVSGLGGDTTMLLNN